jgi:hypothetical protein
MSREVGEELPSVIMLSCVILQVLLLLLLLPGVELKAWLETGQCLTCSAM